MDLQASLFTLLSNHSLDRQMCASAMEKILTGETNPLQTAAFLSLLRCKTETPEELESIIAVLKQNMLTIQTPHKVLDIVGTGGDGANTVNISTGSAILAASCGIKIAKHGNRSVSSLSGSADVLEALGININLTPEKISQCIDKVNIGFCFAPNFRPALSKVRELRKALNIPTTFNLIAPLLNPTNPSHYLLGVYDKNMMSPIAKTLKTERSCIVHGYNLDEISCIGPAEIIEVTDKYLTRRILDPKDYGLEYCQLSDLQGGDAHTNAKLLLDAYSNKNKAISETLILNAGVSLYLYGLHSSIQDGINHAKENCYNGAALTTLKKFREFSNDI